MKGSRQIRVGLALAASFLSLVAIGCAGHQGSVVLEGISGRTERLGDRDDLYLSAGDVELNLEGNVVEIEETQALREAIADRLTQHLGGRRRGDRLRTSVTIESPDVWLMHWVTLPYRDITVIVETELPNGEIVRSAPLMERVDARTSIWVFDWMQNFGTLGILALGMGGFAGALLALPFSPPVALVMLWVTLFVTLPGMLLYAAVLVWRSTKNANLIQLQAESLLGSALERHAADVLDVLRGGKAQQSSKRSERPEREENEPTLPVTTAAEDVAWRFNIVDGDDCVDKETLIREVRAWLPAPMNQQTFSLLVVVSRSKRRRQIDAVLRSSTGEILARKSFSVLDEDCGLVARTLSQALHRQLDVAGSVSPDGAADD